jgi:hypothetical protein
MGAVERIGAFALAVALCALCGCATAYHSKGLTGGYSDSQLDATTYRVEFTGNGFTSRSRVENLMLYRCAELTVNGGHTHFAILKGDTTAGTSDMYIPGARTGSATIVGNSVYWNEVHNPGVHIPVTRYGATVLIRVFDGAPAEIPGAIDARSLMFYLGPSIGRKQAAQVAAASSPSAPAFPPAYLRNPQVKTTLTVPSQAYSSPTPPPSSHVLPSAQGSVPTEINSIPPNAEVHVDGALVGTTPLTAYPLRVGPRQIELAKKGYTNWKRRLLIAEGAPTRVVAELEEGIETVVERIAPPSNQVIASPVAPQIPATCDLTVRTLPREVEVVISGKSMGFTTPNGLKLKVPRGEVVVELRHPGYLSQEQRYTATDGKSKTLRVILKRQKH